MPDKMSSDCKKYSLYCASKKYICITKIRSFGKTHASIAQTFDLVPIK